MQGGLIAPSYWPGVKLYERSGALPHVKTAVIYGAGKRQAAEFCGLINLPIFILRALPHRQCNRKRRV